METLAYLWNKYLAAIAWILLGLIVMLIMWAHENNKSTPKDAPKDIPIYTPNYNSTYWVGGIIIGIGVIHGVHLRFPANKFEILDPAAGVYNVARKLSSATLSMLSSSPRRNAVALSG